MTDKNEQPAIVNKIFIKSKTLWGVVIGIVPLIASLVGVEAPDLGGILQVGLNFLDAANELVGAALVLWGRWGAPGVRLTLS